VGAALVCARQDNLVHTSKEPYTSSKEPYTSSKEPCTVSKESYVYSMQVRKEAWARQWCAHGNTMLCTHQNSPKHLQKSPIQVEKSPIHSQKSAMSTRCRSDTGHGRGDGVHTATRCCAHVKRASYILKRALHICKRVLRIPDAGQTRGMGAAMVCAHEKITSKYRGCWHMKRSHINTFDTFTFKRANIKRALSIFKRALQHPATHCNTTVCAH